MSTTDSTEIQIGVFASPARAEDAVSRLLAAGFPLESISVVCPSCADDDLPETKRVEPAGARTSEAAATGGAIGGVLGGLVAPAGIATSGGASLLVIGPLLGAAAGGTVAGGFVGAMVTRGFEPAIADYYDQALDAGHVLVAVEPGEEREGPPLAAAARILERAGARAMELPRE